MTNASVATSKKIRTLVKLKKGIDVNNQTVYIDPAVLFMRLIVLIERSDETEKFFHYELTPYLTSLFKDHFMWHPNKSSLADALKSKSKKPTKKGEKRKLDECD